MEVNSMSRLNRAAQGAPPPPLEIRVDATWTRLLLVALAVAIGVAVGVDATPPGRVDPVRLALGALACLLALAGSLLVESRRIVLDPQSRSIFVERKRLLSSRRQTVAFDGAHFAFREDRSGRSESPWARVTYQPMLRWPGGEVPLSNHHSISREDFADLERDVARVLAADGGAATAR
jgi:hypothetical protein